ncbi:MAG: Mycofactocin system heme/flavin dehydrogenase, partial [uncultured Pseudonocardia sp.]
GEQQGVVRDGRGGAAPREEAAAALGLPGARRGLGAGHHPRRQRQGVLRDRLPPAHRRPPPAARPGHDRDGPGRVAAGAHLAHRRAGGDARRRGRRRPRRRAGGHGDGTVLLRQQARRGGVRRQPQDVLPDVLGGQPGPDPAARRAGEGRGREGPHRHPRLVLRHPPRLGQPADPREDGPQGHRAVRPGGHPAPPLRAAVGPQRWPARPEDAQPGRSRRGRAHVLRRLRRVDRHPAAHLGRHRLAAQAVGRPVRGEGDHAPRRRQARRRRRGHRDLGVQPRREQPRRHPRLDPRPPRRGRGRGRADRDPARRRHPPRQRRRQGPRPRRPGRDDRARLPVGHGRERRGRRGQRAVHPAQRHRRGAAGPGEVEHPRPRPGGPDRPRRLHPRPPGDGPPGPL